MPPQYHPKRTTTRDAALDILHGFTKSESLRRHALQVEACVAAYAREFGEDETKWRVTALLHDFDYESHPEAPDHPTKGEPMLAGRGVPEDVRRAILSHANYSGVARESRLEKTLFACDELSGFISAFALVKPSRKVAEVDVKSVRKKLKDKAFARSVNREDIVNGAGGTASGSRPGHRLLHRRPAGEVRLDRALSAAHAKIGVSPYSAMLLSVKEMEVRKLPFEQVWQPGEIDFSDSATMQTAPLAAAGVAELLPHTGGEIRVKGSVKTVMEAECDRCLGRASFPINAPFDLFYRPVETTPVEEDEIAIDEGEAEMGFYEMPGLQLEEILREQVLLQLPMQRVCSEACKGICPICGVNRNETSCHCETRAGDDRWSALKDIHL